MSSVQEINKLEVDIASYEGQVEILERQLGEIEDIRNDRYAQVDASKDEYIKQDVARKCEVAVKKYRDRASKVEDEKKIIEEQFFSRSSEINIEEYRKIYDQKTGGVFESVKKISEEVDKKISKFMDDKFDEAVRKRLGFYKAKIQSGNINLFHKRLKAISKGVKSLPKYSSNWIGFLVDQVAGLDFGNDVSEDKKEGSVLSDKQRLTIFLVVLLFILMGLFVYFLFHIVAFLCVGLFVYNLYAYSRINIALIDLKVLTESVDELQVAIDKKLKQNVDEDQEVLLKERNKRMLSCDDELAGLMKKIGDIAEDITRSYVPDLEMVNKEYERIDSELRENKEKYESSLKDTMVVLEDLRLQRDKMRQELSEYLNTLQGQYLDPIRIGKEVVFEGKFLLDVNNNKPVLFAHPKKSCLFVYDEDRQLNTFIKLMLLQLRNTLSPFNCSITIMDSMSMGAVALPFVHKDNELCKVVSSPAEMTSTLENLVEVLGAKTVLVRREFDDIDTYNVSMVEMGSLPEAYKFVFCINSDRMFFNESYVQLLMNGGPVGIHMHSFIRRDLFVDMGEKAVELMSNHRRIWVLNDTLRSRAPEIMISTVLELDD